MPTMQTVEPGIFRRIDRRTGRVLPTLWVHYPGRDKTERESARTTSLVVARKFRAKRMEEHGRGEPGRAAEKVRMAELLDAVEVNYAVNERSSLDTLKSRVKLLRTEFGHLRAIDVTTDLVEQHQRAWQRAGLSNGTVNRRCNVLRRAFTLGRRARKVHFVPYIPRLEEHSPRGRYIAPADASMLLSHLPAYVRDFFTLAYDYGTRKGQLARTLRRYVDVERRVIEWPPAECKHKETHVVPLEGDGLAIVALLMASPPLWCPYLFHGPRCAPGQTPSKRYGCLGDFKKSWAAACKAAGFPVGRKHGGFVFHHTRNTAATNLRAGGMDEADAMKVTGHQTSQVFRHYDLGNVDVLRERLAQARSYAKSLPSTPKVTPISARRQPSDTAARQRVTR
jgi:integrase